MAIRECLPRLTALGISYTDAIVLRRISMTLRRWFEYECGTGEGQTTYSIEREAPWAIERAAWPKSDRVRWWSGTEWVKFRDRRTYEDDEKAALTFPAIPADAAWRETGEKPFMRVQYPTRDGYVDNRWQIPDRENGARRRLQKIMARYPDLRPYVQGDCRGPSLYILRPGDSVDNYSAGIAVYQ